MVIIKRGSTFLTEGALVPSKEELEVMIHALIEEHDRVVRGGGTQYGPNGMHHLKMKAFIGELQRYKTKRGV